MPSARRKEIREFPSASASSGSGGELKKNYSSSFSGASTQGQRVGGGTKPLQRRTLIPDNTAMQSDETKIRSILAELPPLPADVSNWIVQTGVDSTDEPAVWVWAVLPDETTDLDTRIRIRDVVFDFIRKRSDIPIWVYVSFKTEAEMGKQR